MEQREGEEKEEELEEEGENQRDGTMRGKEKVIEVQEIPEKLNCLLYIQRNKTFLYRYAQRKSGKDLYTPQVQHFPYRLIDWLKTVRQ